MTDRPAPPPLQVALPKFAQIANYIRDLVLTGELPPRSEVPSERELAERFGVSRPTATRALNELRAEGLLEARQGLGTFVREEPVVYRRSRDRYLRGRLGQPTQARGEESTILVAELSRPTPAAAAELGIDEDEQAIHRRRVIIDARGKPVELTSSWLSADLAEAAPRLLERAPIMSGTVIYVEQVTGRQARSAQNRIFARLASPEEAEALGLGARPAAVLLVQHTVFDAAGDAMEYAEEVYPPQRGMFREDYAI